MLMEKLKKSFQLNEPIFISEIIEIMKDYLKQRVYQLVTEALNDQTLIRYDNGIYYLPKK